MININPGDSVEVYKCWAVGINQEWTWFGGYKVVSILGATAKVEITTPCIFQGCQYNYSLSRVRKVK